MPIQIPKGGLVLPNEEVKHYLDLNSLDYGSLILEIPSWRGKIIASIVQGQEQAEICKSPDDQERWRATLPRRKEYVGQFLKAPQEPFKLTDIETGSARTLGLCRMDATKEGLKLDKGSFRRFMPQGRKLDSVTEKFPMSKSLSLALVEMDEPIDNVILDMAQLFQKQTRMSVDQLMQEPELIDRNQLLAIHGIFQLGIDAPEEGTM